MESAYILETEERIFMLLKKLHKFILERSMIFNERRQ